MQNNPDFETMLKTEKLLHRILKELGDDPNTLEPHIISNHMHCAVYPDGTLCYTWKEEAILTVSPDSTTGKWRFYTKDQKPL